jgi:hypothetical protein
VLWHSPVIRHDTELKTAKNDRLREHVSLRECFLYFISLACSGPSAENGMKPDSWCGKVPNMSHADDCISDNSSGESSEEPGDRSGKSRTKRETTSSCRGTADNPPVPNLESALDRLSIRVRPSRNTRSTARGERPRSRSQQEHREDPLTLYYSETNRKYYFEGEKGRVYVEPYEENGAYWFEYDGVQYPFNPSKGKGRKR